MENQPIFLSEKKNQAVYKDLLPSLRGRKDSLFHYLEETDSVPTESRRLLNYIGEMAEDPHGPGLSGVLEDLKREDQASFARADRINTFPFGERTNAVYREFLGISTGTGMFGRTLDKALAYCASAVQCYSDEQNKTVIILSDTWDAPKFQEKYAIPFLEYLIHHSVSFLFFLVTDFGTVRIPFPEQKAITESIRKDSCFQIESTSQKERKKQMLNALKSGMKVRFSCQGSTWERNLIFQNRSLSGNYSYEFYFREMRYEKTTGDYFNKTILEGKIPKKAANQFAADVALLYDLPNHLFHDNTIAVDAGSYSAVLGSRSFYWSAVHSAADPSSDPLSLLSDAFNALIASLK